VCIAIIIYGKLSPQDTQTCTYKFGCLSSWYHRVLEHYSATTKSVGWQEEYEHCRPTPHSVFLITAVNILITCKNCNATHTKTYKILRIHMSTGLLLGLGWYLSDKKLTLLHINCTALFVSSITTHYISSELKLCHTIPAKDNSFFISTLAHQN